MTQVEKDKQVIVRQGSPVLRDGATATEKLAALVSGTVSSPPLTRFLGTVKGTGTGKAALLAERRVICPGKVVGQGLTVTVLPTALLLTT